MPFPDGPTSDELVKAHLKIEDAVDDAAISGVVAATNQLVRELPIAAPFDTDPAPDNWSAAPRIVQGATMLAARLFERRNSPQGVAAFGDGAAAYVQRNDPDVAILLRIGPYAKPAVG
jgi:hypothetical protein